MAKELGQKASKDALEPIGEHLPKGKDLKDFVAVFTSTEPMDWFENNPDADQHVERIMEFLPWVRSLTH